MVQTQPQPVLGGYLWGGVYIPQSIIDAADAGSPAAQAVLQSYELEAMARLGIAPAGGQTTGVTVGVHDLVTGSPVVGALVVLAGHGAYTNNLGLATFAGVTDGTQPLTISATGFDGLSTSVSLSGGTVEVDYTLQPFNTGNYQVSLTPQAGTTETTVGTVVTFTGPTTRSGVTVQDPRFPGVGVSALELMGLPAGTYSVSFTKSGWNTLTKPVTITDAQTFDDAVLMVPAPPAPSTGQAVVSVIRGDTGGPAVGVQVTLSGPQSAVAVTNAQGQAPFANLAIGTYQASADGSSLGLGAGSQSFGVTAGSTASVSITLSTTTGTIDVTVTDAAGNPIAGAVVNVQGPQTTSGTTGQNGTATFPQLQPGTYTLVAIAAGYAQASTQVVLTASGSAQSVIPLTASGGGGGGGGGGGVPPTGGTSPLVPIAMAGGLILLLAFGGRREEKPTRAARR